MNESFREQLDEWWQKCEPLIGLSVVTVEERTEKNIKDARRFTKTKAEELVLIELIDMNRQLASLNAMQASANLLIMKLLTKIYEKA